MKPRNVFTTLVVCVAIALAAGCGDEKSPAAPSGSSGGTGGPPTISAILPPGASSGIQIVINGANFGTTAGTVQVGGKDAGIDEWGNDEIKCTLPPGLTESTGGNVSVTTAAAKSVSSQINITPPNTYQVTTDHEMDHYPCWSADGDYIYFSSTRSGGANWDIYRIPATGGDTDRITYDDAADFYPNCKPSTGELAWSSTMRHINNIDGDYEIFYGFPKCLKPGSSCTVGMLTSNESRDLDPAYARTVHAGYSMASTWEEVDASGYFVAWWVVLHTIGPPVQLTEGRQPGFSPNGRSVVYNHDDNIYKMETVGGTPTQLTDTSHDWYPDWGPSDQVVFQRYNGTTADDIMIMNADGTGVHPLVNTRNFEYCPSWSPDGKKVVYYALVGGNYDIYVYVMP